jgi:hypothetical protein
MPTHAEKKQGVARIISFKTSHYRRFWLLACVIAQLVCSSLLMAHGPA